MYYLKSFPPGVLFQENSSGYLALICQKQKSNFMWLAVNTLSRSASKMFSLILLLNTSLQIQICELLVSLQAWPNINSGALFKLGMWQIKSAVNTVIQICNSSKCQLCAKYDARNWRYIFFKRRDLQGPHNLEGEMDQ